MKNKKYVSALVVIIFGVLAFVNVAFAQNTTNQDPANVNSGPRTGAKPEATTEARDGVTNTMRDSTVVATDTELTRRIREEIVKKDISTAAKNVTISTHEGKVHLTGQVASPQEKATVFETAARIVGRANVRNELSVSR